MKVTRYVTDESLQELRGERVNWTPSLYGDDTRGAPNPVTIIIPDPPLEIEGWICLDEPQFCGEGGCSSQFKKEHNCRQVTLVEKEK